MHSNSRQSHHHKGPAPGSGGPAANQDMQSIRAGQDTDLVRQPAAERAVQRKRAGESNEGRSFPSHAFSQGAPLRTSTAQPSILQRAPLETTSSIKISKGVGIKGPNIVSDLKLVQGKLLENGFLSLADKTSEGDLLLKDLKETDQVDAAKIPKTIAAIREYERVVLYKTSSSKYNKPTGQISPGGDAIALMNAQITAPTTTEMSAITSSRSALSTTVAVGGKMNLSGKVGNVADANQEGDLTAVQDRLVAMGVAEKSKLAPEAPAAIRKKYPDIYKAGKTSIDQAHIPETIKAIRNFQTGKKFSHTFWKTRTFAGEDMSKLTWVEGIIGNGDMSEFILSHYQKITYTFKDADGADRSVTASNFQRSDNTIDAAGVSIIGTADPATFTTAEFTSFGISELEARALLFVSKNEGKFNALNTYDKAVVSFGFVQFAGGSGGGTFPTMMANLKKDSPSVFKEKFQNYGIDVEYAEKDGKITAATMVAVDPVSGKILRGQSAEQYIRNMPKLLATFLNAGHNKDVQKAQVKTVVAEYVIPSRTSQFTKDAATSVLTYKKDQKMVTLVGGQAVTFSKSKEYAALPTTDREALTGFTLEGEKISDYLSSEKSRAAIIDQSINMGLGGGAKAVSKGMRDYIESKGEVSKENLKTASEVDILASIRPHAFKPDRVKKVIDDASLSGT